MGITNIFAIFDNQIRSLVKYIHCKAVILFGFQCTAFDSESSVAANTD